MDNRSHAIPSKYLTINQLFVVTSRNSGINKKTYSTRSFVTPKVKVIFSEHKL